MSNIEDMFNLGSNNQEDYDAAEAFDSITEFVIELSNEAKEGRTFTGHDVEMIMKARLEGEGLSPLVREVMKVLAQVISDAQARKTSVDAELERVLLSGIHPMQKRVLQQLREQSQLFDWIKLSSV